MIIRHPRDFKSSYYKLFFVLSVVVRVFEVSHKSLERFDVHKWNACSKTSPRHMPNLCLFRSLLTESFLGIGGNGHSCLLLAGYAVHLQYNYLCKPVDGNCNASRLWVGKSVESWRRETPNQEEKAGSGYSRNSSKNWRERLISDLEEDTGSGHHSRRNYRHNPDHYHPPCGKRSGSYPRLLCSKRRLLHYSRPKMGNFSFLEFTISPPRCWNTR